MIRTDLPYDEALKLPDPKQISIDEKNGVRVDTDPDPVEVPQVVSMRQARIILARYGLLDAVNAQVAALDKEAQITWEYATEVQRDNPLVTAVGAATGMSAAQIDQMFIEANAL